METCKITIQDGRIVDYSGCHYDYIEENGLKATGNGWIVTIKPAQGKSRGKIIAHCEREYSDGLAVCHREFRLEDGTLGLAGGNVHDRYAYFRKANFQRFLDAFGLTAIKREDPNREFSGSSIRSGWGKAYCAVETDGIADPAYDDDSGSREVFEASGANPNLYEGRVKYKVKAATFTVVEQKEDYRDNHNYSRTLYTLEPDMMTLAPALRKIQKRKEDRAKLEEVLYRDGYGYMRDFKTMAEMRAVLEGAIGRSFPKTAVEQPGILTYNGYDYSNCCHTYQYNGIRLTEHMTPSGLYLSDFPRGRIQSLDWMGLDVVLRVRLLGDTVKLFVNKQQLLEFQLWADL